EKHRASFGLNEIWHFETSWRAGSGIKRSPAPRGVALFLWKSTGLLSVSMKFGILKRVGAPVQESKEALRREASLFSCGKAPGFFRSQ
ncbi:hypothetical protein NE695_18380, partial [Neglectibacter timonensis]